MILERSGSWFITIGLVNEGVGVFGSLEDARRGFREHTGKEWTNERKWSEYGGEKYSQEYEQWDVIVGEMNSLLPLRAERWPWVFVGWAGSAFLTISISKPFLIFFMR